MTKNTDYDYSRAFGGLALAARLRRLSERLDRDGARVYACHGVHFEQRWYGILRQLLDKQLMSVSEIADALRISHASVSEARRSMEKAGIIAEVGASGDRRRRMLGLTPLGLELCERLLPLWNDFNAVALEVNMEAGDVVRLLDRLDDILREKSMFDRMMERATARIDEL